MSQHPARQALLGHRFDLLEGEEACRVRRHVEGCPGCARALDELAEEERGLLPTPRPRPRRPAAVALADSTATPIALMLATLCGSALLPPAAQGAALALFATGGAGVIVWLHAVVGRAEAGLRAAEGAGARPSGRAEDETRLAVGTALSLAHALRGARARVVRVLAAAALLALLGGAAFLLTSEALPGTTAEVVAARPTLLGAALVLSLLLGGGLSVSLRLARLARATRSFAERLAVRLEA